MGCPLADTGWEISVQAYYNSDGRLYGEDNYGDHVYGDTPGLGTPAWRDITDANTVITITRGDQDGNIEPPISSLAMEFVDPDGHLFDFDTPRTYFDPDIGDPIRVLVTDPAGARFWVLTTQILERVEVVHNSEYRLVFMEGFDLLSQYAQPLFGWQAPAQSLLDRYAAVLAAVTPAIDYGTVTPPGELGKQLVADPVATDPEDDEKNGIDLLRIAAASVGKDLDTDEQGKLRFRDWPLPWDRPSAIIVSDCEGHGEDVVAVEIGYIKDLEGMLNAAVVEHRDTPALDARTDDNTSKAVYSPRKETLGFPITGAVHAKHADAQALTDRTVARFGGVVNRPGYVIANVRRDPRWLPILAGLDTGDSILVRRTGIGPLEHRCVVVGFEHYLTPREAWETRIYLSTIEQTIGASPIDVDVRWVGATAGAYDDERQTDVADQREVEY